MSEQWQTPDFSNAAGAGSSGSVMGAGKEQLTGLSGAAKHRAFQKADNQKSAIAEQLSGLSSSLRESKAGGPVAPLVDRAAGLMDQAARIIEKRSAEDWVRQAGEQVRSRPLLTLGAVFALGFIGARALR